MAKFSPLQQENTGVLLIDVQEKLFPYVENSCHVMMKMQQAISGCQILNLPILVSEQYPEKLGGTLPSLKGILGEGQSYLSKCEFSCLGNQSIKETVDAFQRKQWIVLGIEAHVCVLQTVRDLLQAEYQVTVLNDAISSRSIYDFSTAIAEMRDMGARISSTETILFEILKTSKASAFKEISRLIK